MDEYEIYYYQLIIKGTLRRTEAENLIFRWLDDPYPNRDGIGIERIDWISDWDYTRARIENNTLPYQTVEGRLNSWLNSIVSPPFPVGSLLWWTREDSNE